MNFFFLNTAACRSNKLDVFKFIQNKPNNTEYKKWNNDFGNQVSHSYFLIMELLHYLKWDEKQETCF